jgi:hypothetical protein
MIIESGKQTKRKTQGKKSQGHPHCPRPVPKVTYLEAGGDIKDAGQAVKKKRGHLGKMLCTKKEDGRRPFPQVQARGV